MSQPQGIAFANDRSVRVAENGSVRAFADQSVSELLTFVERGPAVSALDVGPSGTTWAVAGTGEFTRVPDSVTTKPTWLGAATRSGAARPRSPS